MTIYSLILNLLSKGKHFLQFTIQLEYQNILLVVPILEIVLSKRFLEAEGLTVECAPFLSGMTGCHYLSQVIDYKYFNCTCSNQIPLWSLNL